MRISENVPMHLQLAFIYLVFSMGREWAHTTLRNIIIIVSIRSRIMGAMCNFRRPRYERNAIVVCAQSFSESFSKSLLHSHSSRHGQLSPVLQHILAFLIFMCISLVYGCVCVQHSPSTSNGSMVDLLASAGSLKSSTRISRDNVISSSVSYVCIFSADRFRLPHDSMFSRPTPQITCKRTCTQIGAIVVCTTRHDRDECINC